MNYFVETDPSVRAALIEERVRLEEFLASGGYKAGKAIVDSTYEDAINFILDANPSEEGYAAKVHQAVGEARSARDFGRRFTQRLNEINEALGPLTDEEQT